MLMGVTCISAQWILYRFVIKPPGPFVFNYKLAAMILAVNCQQALISKLNEIFALVIIIMDINEPVKAT